MLLLQIAKKVKNLHLSQNVEKNLLLLLKNGDYDELSSIVDTLFKNVADLAVDLSLLIVSTDTLDEDEDTY